MKGVSLTVQPSFPVNGNNFAKRRIGSKYHRAHCFLDIRHFRRSRTAIDVDLYLYFRVLGRLLDELLVYMSHVRFVLSHRDEVTQLLRGRIVEQKEALALYVNGAFFQRDILHPKLSV